MVPASKFGTITTSLLTVDLKIQNYQAWLDSTSITLISSFVKLGQLFRNKRDLSPQA